MLDNSAEIRKVVSTLIRYFDREQNADVVNILRNAHITLDCINYDNWNGGTYTYRLYVEVDVELFSRYRKFNRELRE